MKNKKNNIIGWFTMFELLIVILIIIILLAIAFINYKWYYLEARDTRRLSDVSELKISLWLYYIETSTYPLPDDWYKVFYDWDILRTQWIIWDNMARKLSKSILKNPLDPLTDTEYVYSVTNTQIEYEILALYESNINIETSFNLTDETNAGNVIYPQIDWTYNKIYIKTPNYIVPTPSIINAEIINSSIVLDEENITSQIITWGSNTPPVWTELSNTWWLDINLSVYTWSVNRYTDNYNKEQIAISIQWAYTWSTLSNVYLYQNILEKESTAELIDFVNEYIFKNVAIETEIIFECIPGYSSDECEIELTCDTQPSYVNATFVKLFSTIGES